MGTKTDILVKLVLVFFISLLSFAVGTFVGKKFSDNQHQFAELEGGRGERHSEAKKNRQTASHDAHSVAQGHEQNAKEELTEDELTKLAEEFVEDDDTAKVAHLPASGHSEHGEKKEHGEDSEGKVKSKKGEKQIVAAHGEPLNSNIQAGVDNGNENHEKGVEEVHSKHATEKIASKVKSIESSKRIPASLPKNPTQFNVGKFTVQVASYAEENEAISLATDLKKKGFNAYYLAAEVNGKKWFRVSVGQFSTIEEAKEFRKDLAEKTSLTSAIVQRISK